MLNFIIISFTVIFYNSAYAITEISIIGACTDSILHHQHYERIPDNTTVGDLSIDFFNKNDIPFIGSREGLKQVLEIPTDDNELIILSDEEMLAYGWCYKVNGLAPEEYPHKISVLPGDKIVWYFAYSRYLKGKWVSQCVPSHYSPREEFCRF